eukprot:GHVO01039634.1.p1 GENE.GHVO01039634.1~~GHVO01039634.1.p1  ORF type:complete len:358 (-),score=30.87 GHVO01039634.1:396-1448(-)
MGECLFSRQDTSLSEFVPQVPIHDGNNYFFHSPEEHCFTIGSERSGKRLRCSSDNVPAFVEGHPRESVESCDGSGERRSPKDERRNSPSASPSSQCLSAPCSNSNGLYQGVNPAGCSPILSRVKYEKTDSFGHRSSPCGIPSSEPPSSICVDQEGKGHYSLYRTSSVDMNIAYSSSHGSLSSSNSGGSLTTSLSQDWSHYGDPMRSMSIPNGSYGLYSHEPYIPPDHSKPYGIPATPTFSTTPHTPTTYNTYSPYMLAADEGTPLPYSAHEVPFAFVSPQPLQPPPRPPPPPLPINPTNTKTDRSVSPTPPPRPTPPLRPLDTGPSCSPQTPSCTTVSIDLRSTRPPRTN